MLPTPIFIFNVHVWYNTNLFFEALPSDMYFLVTTVALLLYLGLPLPSPPVIFLLLFYLFHSCLRIGVGGMSIPQ